MKEKKPKLQKVEQETIPVKYRIYPNLKQRKYLERCFSVSRIVWNWLLGVQKDYAKGITEWTKEKHSEHLEKFTKKLDLEKKSVRKKLGFEINRLKKEEEVPVGFGKKLIRLLVPNIEEEEVVKLVMRKKDESLANKTLSTLDLKRQIKFLREEKPFLKTVASEGIYHVPLNLAKAWSMCFDKNFKDFKEPRFKNKFCKQSFTFDRASLDLETGRLKIPPFRKGIFIKTKVHRVMEGEQKRITVQKTKSGDYYASVNFRQAVYFPEPKAHSATNTVGIDLGIKDDYVIMSNGLGSVKNPKFFKKHKRKIAILNRKLSRAEKGSNSRRKVIHQLNKEYEKLTKAREDFQHKVSHDIVSHEKVKAVAVENLNVKGMTSKNKAKEGEDGHFLPNGQGMKKKLNRAILDAGFGRVRQMLEYKCKRNGKAFYKVDQFFPSSKTCNHCGFVNKELKVSEQYWTCENCNTEHERNFNAAVNIRDEALKNKNKKKPKKKTVKEKVK